MNAESKSSKSDAQNRVGVVVATKARPQALGELLRLLEYQSRLPSLVVISATGAEDVQLPLPTALNIECVYGSPGLTAQRNRGLAQIKGRAEVAVFFDDDFAPAENWLEQCARLFCVEPRIAGASGIVLRDGVRASPFPGRKRGCCWRVAGQSPPSVAPIPDLYGCNMAFRISAIDEMQFDERLVLYGWLEDKDFSRSAARQGGLVRCSLLVGVAPGTASWTRIRQKIWLLASGERLVSLPKRDHVR